VVWRRKATIVVQEPMVTKAQQQSDVGGVFDFVMF
jgi:hypothetical protein